MPSVQRLTRWFGAAPSRAPAEPAPGDDDWRLLRGACQGDAPSARRLVQALTPQARGLALRLLGSAEDADDAVQDSFLRLWTSGAVDGHGARLATYFNTIVINRCRSLLVARREWATDPAALGELHDTLQADGRLAPQTDTVDPAAPCNARLALALSRLPPRQRLAITMWAFADSPSADIAAALELDLNATHQLLYRARQNLRQQLDGDPR